jgi:hypothetical protein
MNFLLNEAWPSVGLNHFAIESASFHFLVSFAPLLNSSNVMPLFGVSHFMAWVVVHYFVGHIQLSCDGR